MKDVLKELGISSLMAIRLRQMNKKMHDRVGGHDGYHRRSSAFGGKVLSLSELARQHLNQEGKCYYTGLEYDASLSFKHPLYPSCERLDPTKDYSVGNVVIVCLFVNFAKHHWSLSEIIPYWKYLSNITPYTPALGTSHLSE